MKKKKLSKLNRRSFLKGSAILASAPYVVPSSALGRDGNVAPSERIVMGCIGIRGRGMHDLQWMLPEPDTQFVAICDLRKVQRLSVKAHIDNEYGNKDCKMYPEIREFLAERTDIDAVLIATGDRWHALASILAMRAGKDVYTEKPSAMTIAEGRSVVETAKRYGRVYQTGTQRLSEGNFIFANELVRLGKLGNVHTARAHIAPWDAAEMRHDWLPAQPEPAKEDVDWNAWLGACPWRPYNESYVKGGWRGFYDFHTSCIGEWGAHTFAQAQVGIGASDTAASEYQYVENESGDGMVTKFKNGVNMVLERGDKYWYGSCGVRYEGDEGWVATADRYARPAISNPKLLKEYNKILQDYLDRTQRSLGHPRNFFDCVKSRQLTVANPEVMHHSMSSVHAANICMWLKRDLHYDAQKEQFIGDPQANRFLARAMRDPYII